MTTDPAAVQLALSLSDETDDALRVRASRLAELSAALPLLLAVADGCLPSSPTSLMCVRNALDVVAAFAPGGRLGHVVRRFRIPPPGGGRWSELTEELEFATNLCPRPRDR